MSDACQFCGLVVESPCETPPVDICETAINSLRWAKEADMIESWTASPTINAMCEFKTDSIMHMQGYKKTGYVLRHTDPQERICVSEGGAVSWFTRDQWQWLMHNRDHVEFEWPKPFGATRLEPPAPIKDHLIAQAVNQITAVAREFHATGQLRERIAQIVVPLLKHG